MRLGNLPRTQWIDSHCHLGHDGGDPHEWLARAAAAGVVGCVDVGIDALTSGAAAARARVLRGVAWSAGLHPCSARELHAQWPAIESLARAGDCAALGETGFDFHWDPDGHAPQRDAFVRHLELAAQLGLPVVVHCRSAFAATFDVLAAHRDVRAVMHCFSGGPDEARRALDLGCWLSFAGPLTYPRNDALRAAAQLAPLDRILIETDAPFLPPQSRRGRPNEPAYAIETGAALATARGEPLEVVAQATTRNARALFRTLDQD
ncbi:MAG: TatD family hydrolase [Planctomycetes bacterium]|nr:TatD family hydrolase [Planctomycetota bacterium]